jgi:hypothetical protein
MRSALPPPLASPHVDQSDAIDTAASEDQLAVAPRARLAHHPSPDGIGHISTFCRCGSKRASVFGHKKSIQPETR